MGLAEILVDDAFPEDQYRSGRTDGVEHHENPMVLVRGAAQSVVTASGVGLHHYRGGLGGLRTGLRVGPHAGSGADTYPRGREN